MEVTENNANVRIRALGGLDITGEQAVVAGEVVVAGSALQWPASC